jgi:tRNA A-37 threonylcarbamoyl transferase component Bud32
VINARGSPPRAFHCGELILPRATIGFGGARFITQPIHSGGRDRCRDGYIAEYSGGGSPPKLNSLPRLMTDRSITEIGKYKILSVVGEGAMGVVYRATDSVLDRTVAIKVMSEAIARQQDLRTRFLREAQAAGSMQHPNIVSIYDLGEMDGHLYIAMEFVEGVDLEQVIANREPLTLQAKLDIIIDVLAGLAYAHKRGIVHRDVKPANIRIAEDGRAKIMDFGVAHLSSSTMTRTGMVVGTPAYMAPEQVTGMHTTPATDLFAVGAVFYELLTGLKAFAAPTLQSLFFKIVTEPPVSMLSLLPGLPDELNRITEKALAKSPADRYANALEMANDLTMVRATLSGSLHPGTVSLSATVAQAIAVKERARTRTRNLALAGGGLALAAVAAIWFVGSRNGEASIPSVQALPVNPAAATTLAKPKKVNEPKATSLAETASVARGLASEKKSPDEPSATPAEDAAARSRSLPSPPSRKASTGFAPKPKTAAPSPRAVAAQRKTDLAPKTPTTTKSSAITGTPRVQPPPVVRDPGSPIPGVVGRPVTPAPLPAPSPAPAPPPPPAQAVAPPAPNTADVAATVEAYARAIESRDVGAIRRVYPSLSAAQESSFQRFFDAARRINVTFRVSALEGSGSSAEARLTGNYEYVTTDGKSERQPVSFAASFRHDGSAWRLVSVR